MKGKLVVLGVALALGLVAFTPGAYAGGSQSWQGVTTQGLPMDFMLVTAHGQTTISTWDFEFETICVDSGNIIDYGLGYFGFDIPVVNGKFSFVDNDPFGYFSWSGRIGEGQAKGVAKAVLPALTPKIKAEICTSGQPQWLAQPSGVAAVRSKAPEVRIVIVKHEDGSVSRTVTDLSR